MLRQLPPIVDPNVIIGTRTNDDAAVYRLSNDVALVATVDYFTPVVDDPYAFGLVAAANALSDIYAMGGTPLFALNLVGFPRTGLPMAVLGDILRGGSDKAREAGISIIGGHSIDDPEPKYGMMVLGTVHPDRVVANVGACPGDLLYLTKPLGIGIIATAIKRGLASPETIDEAVAVMATLNRAGSTAMNEVGVHAATDVTGFGLLGHLGEMVNGSGVGARIWLDRVPVLDVAWEFARQGVVPGGTRRNFDHVREFTTFAPEIDESAQLMLADAQTSGGLLIAVAPERADALEAALRGAGTLAVARIGEVVAEPGITVLARAS